MTNYVRSEIPIEPRYIPTPPRSPWRRLALIMLFVALSLAAIGGWVYGAEQHSKIATQQRTITSLTAEIDQAQTTLVWGDQIIAGLVTCSETLKESYAAMLDGNPVRAAAVLEKAGQPNQCYRAWADAAQFAAKTP